MSDELRGQVAVVSGAARGLGLACARALGSRGAHVILTDIDDSAGQAAAHELVSADISANFMKLDVSDVAAIRRCASTVDAAHGRLDILVNNAGIALVAEIEDVTEEQFDRTMQINLKGAFFLSQAVVPILKRQRAGRIINIASVAGRTGGVMPLAPYAASKAAVLNITKTFASYLAPFGATVNAVAPGPIETDLTRSWTEDQRERVRRAIPWGRFATAEEIAGVVAFLAGPAAAYMTGATVDVNGGLRMD